MVNLDPLLYRSLLDGKDFLNIKIYACDFIPGKYEIIGSFHIKDLKYIDSFIAFYEAFDYYPDYFILIDDTFCLFFNLLLERRE